MVQMQNLRKILRFSAGKKRGDIKDQKSKPQSCIWKETMAAFLTFL